MVNENELKIIDEIAQKNDLTQRQISQNTALSLGAVNIIIKRLIERGVIKTQGLNSKKTEYMLTPKGFSEKAKKSYEYVRKTVNLVKQMRDQIAVIVFDEIRNGQKKFIIMGDDDLADLIELALKGFDYQRVQKIEQIKDKDALVLLGEKKFKTNGFRVLNIAEKLGKAYWGTNYHPERNLS